MQRDLDLLESLQETAILRIYSWSGSWVSYGYFQKEEDAQAHFAEEEIRFVQRPTGGGLVDHRRDLTYTLVIPKGHFLAELPRAECYRRIHRLVQLALGEQGIDSLLLDQESGAGPACFSHPVPGDLVDSEGRKLAGAAQRRTRHGVLHQGSVLAPELEATLLAKIFQNQFARQPARKS